MQKCRSTCRTNLDWKHGNALGSINVVPHTQVATVLCDNDVTARNPLQ